MFMSDQQRAELADRVAIPEHLRRPNKNNKLGRDQGRLLAAIGEFHNFLTAHPHLHVMEWKSFRDPIGHDMWWFSGRVENSPGFGLLNGIAGQHAVITDYAAAIGAPVWYRLEQYACRYQGSRFTERAVGGIGITVSTHFHYERDQAAVFTALPNLGTPLGESINVATLRAELAHPA